MIVYTMKNWQIIAEARKDFVELSGKARILQDRFTKASNFLLSSRRNPFIRPQQKQTVLYKTHNGNTWTIYLQDYPNKVEIICCAYLAIPFKNGHEYLFIRNFKEFHVEKYTRHFIQRYEERHVIPYKVDIKHLPLPIHFALTHVGERMCYVNKYYNKELNIREDDTRDWIIMGDGMVVVEDKTKDPHMWTFITYLDLASLYDFQQALLEEEEAWQIQRELMDYFRRMRTEHIGLTYRTKTLANRMVSNPKTPLLIERYLRRTGRVEEGQLEQIIEVLHNGWSKILKTFNGNEMKEHRMEFSQMCVNKLVKSIVGRKVESFKLPRTIKLSQTNDWAVNARTISQAL